MKKNIKKNSSKKKSSSKAISEPFIYTLLTNQTTCGFLLLIFSCLAFISLFSFGLQGNQSNWLGLLGHILGWSGHALFGLTSYIFCAFFLWVGWRLIFHRSINHLKKKFFVITFLVLASALLLSVIEDNFSSVALWIKQAFYPGLKKNNIHFHFGGAPIFFVYKDLPHFNLLTIFNITGIIVLSLTGLFISLFSLLKYNISSIVSLFEKIKKIKFPSFSQSNQNKMELLKASVATSLKSHDNEFFEELMPFTSAINATCPPIREEDEETFYHEKDIPKNVEGTKEINKGAKREQALEQQRIYNGDFTAYQLPSSQLLTPPKKQDHSQLKKDLKRQAEILEQTLLNFGIEAKVGQINCGPTITSFEVHPAIGVKVQKIKALENDIALNLKARSTRIIAPIPGKAAVGIEVPNAYPQEVGFKEILQAYQQREDKFRIPMLLGKAVNGDFVMSDLTKMPHCIIAGATGAGKSVCINTIVMSIVLNAKPDEIKMVMVDPKKVELTPYTRLPHMLAPVITEPQGACSALNWLVKEMERRYELLKLTATRNIDAFNQRTINKEAEAAFHVEVPEKLPYIVVIIDELADLMMVSSSDIETPIARLAQMARAVGIHQILATQRPSREVITGLIKANFPARIAFKVASRVNSQIILDESGAETLLGNGDMLFLPPGTSHCLRAQGAYIRDNDIHQVVEHICSQAPPNYLIESFDTMHSLSGNSEEDESLFDSLYHEAYEIVVNTGNASTTFLQRKLKIGYARAASLMDQLEKKGVVTPPDGSKARKVLVRKNKEKKDSEEF